MIPIGSFVLIAVLFAFLDALLIRKFRRMERQRRVAENDYLHERPSPVHIATGTRKPKHKHLTALDMIWE